MSATRYQLLIAARHHLAAAQSDMRQALRMAQRLGQKETDAVWAAEIGGINAAIQLFEKLANDERAKEASMKAG